MGATVQKSSITLLFLLSSMNLWAESNALKPCGSGPLMVAQKQVGMARYMAQDCSRVWQDQDMQIEFSYTQAIPEWAFKRAATHFLKRNIQDAKYLNQLNGITQLYQPVKPGDIYRLSYQADRQTLKLMLNQQVLGRLQHPKAQQYFNIWLGSQPFSAKLKQQLLD